jgi:hypothetical protein
MNSDKIIYCLEKGFSRVWEIGRGNSERKFLIRGEWKRNGERKGGEKHLICGPAFFFFTFLLFPLFRPTTRKKKKDFASVAMIILSHQQIYEDLIPFVTHNVQDHGLATAATELILTHAKGFIKFYPNPFPQFYVREA